MFSVLLVKGRTGKDLLMMEGYTYYKHKIMRDGFRWSCTQMGSRSCRGFLHVNHDMFVLRAFTEHTHPPPWKIKKFKKNKDVSMCYFIKTLDEAPSHTIHLVYHRKSFKQVYTMCITLVIYHHSILTFIIISRKTCLVYHDEQPS